MFFIDGDEVHAGAGVRNVIVLCVDAHVFGTVSLLLEIPFDFVPRRAADVLEDNDRRSVVLDPPHHTTERTPGLSMAVDVLLLIVQVGVVDAGCTSNENVNVAWYRRERAICSRPGRMTLVNMLVNAIT